MTDRERILWVTPKPPFPLISGDRIRQFNLIRRLSARHAIDLLTFTGDPGDEDALAVVRRHCARVIAVPLPPRRSFPRRLMAVLKPRTPFYWSRYRSADFWRALVAVTAARRYAAVDVQHVYMAPYLEALPSGPTRVLTLHNIESILTARCGAVERSTAKRAYWKIESTKLAAMERRWLPAVDAAVVMSEIDATAAAALAPGARVSIVGNGVDVEDYAPTLEGRDDRSIVFTGSLGYPPNADAVAYLLDAIWPRVRRRLPDATCTIVGRDPSRQLRARNGTDGVTVTGPVAEVRPYLARAGVVVVPLRAGGGTRLKILEAMATASAVVSTRLGAEGLRVEDGKELCLADEPATFAASIVRLLTDAEFRRRLGVAGRRRVESTYDWRFSADALDRLYAMPRKDVSACAS